MTAACQLGFDALNAGCEVNTYGMPFYAGWGITNDWLLNSKNRSLATNSTFKKGQAAANRRVSKLHPNQKKTKIIDALFAAAYLDYSHYYIGEGEELTKCNFQQAVDEILRRKTSFFASRLHH